MQDDRIDEMLLFASFDEDRLDEEFQSLERVASLSEKEDKISEIQINIERHLGHSLLLPD